MKPANYLCKGFAFCLAMTAVALTASAQNPISQTEFTADPAPLVVGDTLNLYTSLLNTSDAADE